MACKTWVRFLFLLKPHTSKRWGRGGGEGKPRRYQQNDVKKGHVFSLLLLLTKVRALEFSPWKTPSPQRGNSPKRDAKHWRGSEDGHHWGWTAVQAQILCVQCGSCETQIHGQNVWMHTGLHLYIQGGEYSKAVVILAWKYHKKPLLVWGFFLYNLLISV